MLIPRFNYLRPSSLNEACEMKSDLGEKACILAGGTDVIVNMKKGIIARENLISIRDVNELKDVSSNREKGKIRIGTCATASEIMQNGTIGERIPALAAGADSLGSPLIRNLATIGGNLVTARPAGDLMPALIAYDAKLVLTGLKGDREVSCQDFFTGPGKTIIREDEILREVIIHTPPPCTGCSYIKLGIRRALEIGLVNVAAFISLEDHDGPIKEARIVLGSVAPKPIRSVTAEKILIGEKPGKGLFIKAAKAASEDCSPIDDFRGSAEYRKEMVKNLTKRGLLDALNQLRKN